MAVSKRTRYEVLRRDNHTCRYCGDSAPNVTLQVDHVIPSTLGGSDKPDNLVAACKDCNAGKSSASATDTVVADVDEKAIKWKQAILDAAELLAVGARERREMFRYFEDEWSYRFEEPVGPLPDDWRGSLIQFRELGLPMELIDEAIDITVRKRVPQKAKFNYFAGICWNHIRTIHDAAQASMGEAHKAAHPCDHCENCQSGHPESCDVLIGPEWTLCAVCNNPACMFRVGRAAGRVDQTKGVVSVG